MGLWNFLGGNKIGPGHPRYERELKKYNEGQRLHLEVITKTIMMRGMPETLRFEKEEDIINVLKQYPNCPQFTTQGCNWGKDERHINNWNQAQKWLKTKENPD